MEEKFVFFLYSLYIIYVDNNHIYILLKLKSFLEGNIYIYNPNELQNMNMNIFHYKELIKEK